MDNTRKISSFLYLAAFLLLLGFIIRLGADYYQYLEGLKAYPFYVYVLGRGSTFLLPSLICLAGGKMLRSENVKNSTTERKE